MKHYLLFLLGLTVEVDTQVLKNLNSLQWKNRVIILNEMDDNDHIIKVLESQQKEILERDILWFMLSGNNTNSNYSGKLSESFAHDLRQQFGPKNNQVILVGKDGGLKSIFDGVDLQGVFANIDSMPMRQLEMQRQ